MLIPALSNSVRRAPPSKTERIAMGEGTKQEEANHFLPPPLRFVGVFGVSCVVVTLTCGSHMSA